MYDSESQLVVIAGRGAHLGQVRSLAERATSNVVVLEEYLQQAPLLRHTAGVKFIATATTQAGAFDFWTALRAAETLGLNDYVRTFHPVALAEHVIPAVTPSIVTCGFPGSGNGILQTVIEELFTVAAAGKSSTRDEGSAILSAFASDYLGLLLKKLEELSAAIGTPAPSLATLHGNFISASWKTQPKFLRKYVFRPRTERLLAIGLPARNYLFEFIHKTHEPYGHKLQTQIARGTTCFYAVRHPLDIIVSIAGKLAVVSASNILDDDDTLAAIGQGLVTYSQSFTSVAGRSNFNVVHYESWWDDPYKVVGEITQALGYDVSRTQQGHIVDKYLGKPLPGKRRGGGHYWQPGSGKWERYLSTRNLAVLRDVGIQDLAVATGYEFPSMQNCSASASSREQLRTANGQGKNLAAAIGFLIHCCPGSDYWRSIAKAHGLKVIDGPTSATTWMTDSERIAVHVNNFIAKPDFRRLLEAAGT